MAKRKWTLTGLILIVLIMAAVILVDFARMAEPVNDERADWLTSTLIAHKGLHDQKIPENSIASISRAVEKGYIIEMDVSMTKDKQIVVFHDKKLKRLFGMDAYLKDMTYAQIAKLQFPNTQEKVPLFSDVLKLVNGRVPLLIEIKNEGDVGEMESLVYAALKNYKGQYAIQAFNPYTVKWFRVNAPQVLRGQLSGSFIISDYEVEYAGTTRLPWHKKFLLSNLLLDFESRPNFIAYEIKHSDKGTFKNLRKLGVPVLGWTISNKAEYQRMKNECDNFIVDAFDLE